MTTTERTEYTLHQDALPEWGIPHIWVAQDSNGDIYFPVRPLCESLGIDRGTQNAAIRSDSRLRAGARDIRLPPPPHGKGGSQETFCIRQRELGIWLALIDPDRIGPRAIARGRLHEFQRALWHVAERMLFHGKAATDASAIPYQEPSGALYLPCLKCGTPHKLSFDNGRATWELNERE